LQKNTPRRNISGIKLFVFMGLGFKVYEAKLTPLQPWKKLIPARTFPGNE
jgi:hypothetical protein